MNVNAEALVCDTCGREFQDEHETVDCDEVSCPFATSALDPYAPLDFNQDKQTIYIPEYHPMDEDI